MLKTSYTFCKYFTAQNLSEPRTKTRTDQRQDTGKCSIRTANELFITSLFKPLRKVRLVCDHKKVLVKISMIKCYRLKRLQIQTKFITHQVRTSFEETQPSQNVHSPFIATKIQANNKSTTNEHIFSQRSKHSVVNLTVEIVRRAWCWEMGGSCKWLSSQFQVYWKSFVEHRMLMRH